MKLQLTTRTWNLIYDLAMERSLNHEALPSLKCSSSSYNGEFGPQALGGHKNAEHENEKEPRSLVRKPHGAHHLGVWHDQRFKPWPKNAPNHRDDDDDGLTRLTLGADKKSVGTNSHSLLSDEVSAPTTTSIPRRAPNLTAPKRGRKRFAPKFNMAAAVEFVRILREQRQQRAKNMRNDYDGNDNARRGSESTTEIEELDLSLRLRI
ncbi:hypothetical protein Dimus_002081 [Dionaea muscipula]